MLGGKYIKLGNTHLEQLLMLGSNEEPRKVIVQFNCKDGGEVEVLSCVPWKADIPRGLVRPPIWMGDVP